MTDKPKPARSKGGKTAGRKTVLNADLIAELCGHVEKGATNGDAATMTGIAPGTLYDWINKAEEQPDKYPLCVKFSDSLIRARAKWKQSLIDRLQEIANDKSAKGNQSLEATKFLLERRFPEDYGRKLEIDGKLETPQQALVQVEFVKGETRAESNLPENEAKKNESNDGSV